MSRDVNLHNADSTTGRKAAGDAVSMVLAVEDKAVLDAISAKLDVSLSALAASLENVTVTGNVAHGSADSGNPVKVGGVYNAVAPSLLNGQRADLQFDSTGSLRVAPSPDKLVTGTISASGQSVVINTEGLSTVGWATSGTWVGTIISEISYDGVDWYAQETLDTDTGNNFIVTSFTESLNNDPWITNVAGSRLYRLRSTAWSSGSANIILNGAVGTGPIMVYQSKSSAFNAQVVGAYAAGTVSTPKPLITGGVDGGGVLRYSAASSAGHRLVDLFDSAGASVTLGQKLMASSLPVVLSSDQSAIAITVASLPLPAGAATSANQTTANNSLSSIDGKFNSLGQKLMAGSVPVVLSSDHSGITVTGAAAVGAAPTANPLSVSGVDGGGLKRHLLTDTSGRLSVIHPEVSAAAAAAVPSKIVYIGGKDAAGNLQPHQISSVSGKQAVVASSQVVEDTLANKTYCASVDSFNIPAAGIASNVALFRNPAGSGKKIVLLGAIFDTLSAAGRIAFRAYSAPTVTITGTILPIVSRHLGGGAAASVVNAFSGPSTSAPGTLLTGPLSVSGSSNSLPLEVAGSLILEPGTDILLTGVPDANNRLAGITLIWEEI
jgi:hypothetical protein